MNTWILVLFFAMTPLGGTEDSTKFTKLFIEMDSRVECEVEMEKLQEFKMVTPIATFELAADCFPAAPEEGTQEYNEDIYPHPFMEQCESFTDCEEQELLKKLEEKNNGLKIEI